MSMFHTRSVLAGLLFLSAAQGAISQINTTYSVAASQRVYAPITGGQLLASGVFDDDVLQTNVPTVFFNGTYYNVMYISTNGFITFGSAATTTTYQPINSTLTYTGAASPFGANLKNATTGSPEIRWEQVGNEVIIQWQDVSRFSGVSERFSFQSRFNVVTGAVQFIYSSVNALNAATGQQPQVGLRGTSNSFPTQVKNYSVASGAETWLAPLNGTANNANMRFTSTAPAKSPLGGEAYTYTPICLSPVATTAVTTNCTTNSFTVAVTITSLGTAAAANITATPGGTLYSGVGLGTYQCGPFTLGTPVTLRVVHSTSAGCTNILGIFNPAAVCATVVNGDCLLEPYLDIPDDGCSSGAILQATIPISGVGPVIGIAPGQTNFQALEFIIAHTYRGDLQVRLTSPSGQTRDMLLNAPTPQAAGSNFGNPGGCPGQVLQLRDVGGAPLSTMNPDLNNITGIYTPVQSLSGFTGDPNGNWVLSVCDGGAADAGTLRFVRLRFVTVDCTGNPGGLAGPGTICNDNNPNTTNDVYDANCVCVGTATTGITVNVKGLLEGPLVSATGIMNDGLRSPLVIPTAEPYTALGFTQVGGGGETVNASVFTATGNDAIVDWVLLELRNAANNTQVVRTRCALIQRDGDVVDVNGTSPVAFPVAAGNYFVALRHRNHHGVMTSAAVALSSSPAIVDFRSPTTSVFGVQALKTVGTNLALWAGNARRDVDLKYTGSNNDRDPILVRVGSTTPNNSVPGYFPEDVNLDGSVKYTGSGNDRDPILVNVGSTTPNNTRTEQLP
jgi:subtilisin-like proprotein convertase family protein